MRYVPQPVGLLDIADALRRDIAAVRGRLEYYGYSTTSGPIEGVAAEAFVAVEFARAEHQAAATGHRKYARHVTRTPKGIEVRVDRHAGAKTLLGG